MRIVEEFPPNYELICTVLGIPPRETTFAYGDIIYNPSGRELEPDIIFHEHVHRGQQGDDPDAWWLEYLTNPQFRYEQELDAYGRQYAFAKDAIETMDANLKAEGKRPGVSKTKMLEYALDSMARALSGQSYGFTLSYGEAVSKIRKYASVAQ